MQKLYSKKQVVAFLEWVHLNYQPAATEGMFYDQHAHGNGEGYKEFTASQLFSKYIKHLNKRNDKIKNNHRSL